ncbi:MAG: hypothetical protein JO343_10700 [Candidatus Eremiobacteraeota bacterium]|nr:hypothetical protein [Candidatus Eremiobacteraeota bacterium]
MIETGDGQTPVRAKLLELRDIFGVEAREMRAHELHAIKHELTAAEVNPFQVCEPARRQRARIAIRAAAELHRSVSATARPRVFNAAQFCGTQVNPLHRAQPRRAFAPAATG